MQLLTSLPTVPWVFVVVGSKDVRASFDIEDVDRAIAFLANTRAVDRASTVRYTAVFEVAGLPAPQDLHADGESDLVTLFMKSIHVACVERMLPPLDALVVHVTGPRKGYPGHGYFTVNMQVDPFGGTGSAEALQRAVSFWHAQLAEVERWGDQYRRGQTSL
ncbi:MAG: hypothetical protein QOG97_3313 [Acidimicrobiaceae bacterium]|jgi:hypothetical protein|nr:hypothetical protein [Acidimicrobiaceae bacterium]